MKDIFRFFSDVRLELNKVFWPSVPELIGSVIVVLILVIFFSIYLGSVDLFFYRIAERVF